MSCITTSQIFALINEVATNLFSPFRGLRQGFPLSPYLFLLVVDGLSKLLKEAVNHNELQGLLVGKAFSITHLLFIDDIMLFCFENERNLKNMLEILDIFVLEQGW